MSSRRFQRCIENFVCEWCNASISGDGYTNHCNVCLYSKHVDNNPGDRQASCRGLMMPVQILIKGGQPHSIIHRCKKCGFERPNKLSEIDSRDVIFLVAASYQMRTI